MDQTQHITKIEAHPYHGAANVSLEKPRPMFDPACPLCRAEREAASFREIDPLPAHPDHHDD